MRILGQLPRGQRVVVRGSRGRLAGVGVAPPGLQLPVVLHRSAGVPGGLRPVRQRTVRRAAGAHQLGCKPGTPARRLSETKVFEH
ncbi:MAG: hypothetical protein RMY64_20225 [Nostoc sp. DedQUE08]|uniref:hypothetical protein n=1 Tax=unclassified Nostoc TaxID=2593658 RepID=UPI002AD3ACA8|nr:MULTISPECIES: hypothetical protein [unclassified Nostoc]MDZ8033073.1 hypothetical protein [Nostoc sp. DedSLP04]MDZ8067922.1 hypothetical protein [Nostoc sp. DedQUE08]MDZ8132524.1 hypothetical protein [Nostoc sp. DedQUE07]